MPDSVKTAGAAEREPLGAAQSNACGAAPTRDVELVARFIRGDAAALAELFDRHHRRLYSYCYQILRNRERAEDLLQAMWERLIRLRLEGKLTPKNPLALLYTIVRNLALDEQRLDRHHRSLHELPESLHPAEPILELSRLEELVLMAIDRLPENYREVLVLRMYSGYSFDEIAEMLGETPGSVRTRSWRARAQLTTVVAALMIEDDSQSEGENE